MLGTYWKNEAETELFSRCAGRKRTENMGVGGVKEKRGRNKGQSDDKEVEKKRGKTST